MAVIEEVEQFLSEFKTRLSIWGVTVREDRRKNFKTLSALDITPAYRINVLKELRAKDYCDGPLTDTLNKGPDLWVFGISIKNNEIYIKISLGLTHSRVDCISFHLAEYPLRYPLK